ncbi:MAG TPA: EipA family protein [Candidatus Baltobacteraceae bacterium]|nr:EipA family protein [Candidatus Baltobacteraceae bacterium]
MQRKMMWGVLIAVLVGVSMVPFTQAASPDATLKLSEGSVAAGVGYSWGSGTLTFRGQNYAFKVDGISVGTVGINRADATGSVYNLKSLEDFNGTYTAVGVGATVAGGGLAVTMRNQKGVELNLVGMTQGLDFKFSVDGVKFTLNM